MKFPTTPREDGCVICGSNVMFVNDTWFGKKEVRVYANECQSCGFIEVLDNPWQYKEEGFTENSTVGPRVGNKKRPGREFYMAQLGLQGIDKENVSVFILGSGLSLDFQHIARLDQVGEVFLSDYDNFTNCKNFIPIEDQGKRTFDLVIACEVIEHFENPKDDWKRLASNLSSESVFVLSTNFYDQSPLDRHWYVYIPGHVSYYTGGAVQELCKQNDLHVDFRVPLVATQTAGPRKRYVIGSPSADVVRKISLNFASEMFAPSESDKRAKVSLLSGA